MRGLKAALLGALSGLHTVTGYWLEDIAHQGISPFNPDPSYVVFRNVKDFGAVGDGVHDDTQAINNAITSGDRCALGSCNGSTVSPAVVYLPGGTYLISDSILDYYYTQIIGDPTDMPIIKASASFPTNTTLGLIDGNQYQDGGKLAYLATNVFFRQVRNIVFDTTAIPAEASALAIHWPSSQATSIQNCVFRLASGPSSRHVGLSIEEGSGGFLGDLVFYGGMYGAQLGNQQYTARNLTFVGAQTAITHTWNWFWTYKSLTIVDCAVGVNMMSTGVGSATFVDSIFRNVGVAITTGRDPNATELPGQGTLVLENVLFDKVTAALDGVNGVIIPGDSQGQVHESSYIIGNFYDPHGPTPWQKSNTDVYPAPQALLLSGKYYERSKPQYEDVSASCILSARSFGAKGDGQTDDTTALNALFQAAAVGSAQGLVAFVDAGYYRVTNTVYIPPGARIVGEALSSVIMGAGARFADIESPYPVVQVGKPGETGTLEWSDMLVSTQGPAAGAVLIEYNLAAPAACVGPAREQPAGIWDVHTRVGGFAGSQLQVAQCLKTPDEVGDVDPACIAAYMSMHITRCAGNLYMENNWLWVADHDIEDANNTQISVFAGRGLLVEAAAGAVWVVASGVEHHTLYQYQLVDPNAVWMGQIQSETPYYQPNPPAPYPFTTVNATLHDPDFTADCAGVNSTAPCAMAWGLRVVGDDSKRSSSRGLKVFGAGLYSFFSNYNTSCSATTAEVACQAQMAWVDGEGGPMAELYDFSTVGSESIVTYGGEDVASAADNGAGFAGTLALFQS
ncbi:Glucan 1,3-beta-glucosidase [Pleurostoma richardsiae]|uniref:Glucan 1,3-beta-glucosidase n=1 Tax=Pleurostoma richardsiae TaxID=41990 RepID=A0AA38SBE7_9PEZI|nr:Glucan 1,3-beta-glucosidase [Pleurostoma richardsiae]